MKTKELNSSMLCNPKKIFPTSHRGILQMKKQYLDKISNKNKAINFFPIRKSYEKPLDLQIKTRNFSIPSTPLEMPRNHIIYTN